MDSVNGKNVSPKRKLNIKGTMAGYGAGLLAQSAVAMCALLPSKVLTKFSKSLSKDEIKLVNSSAEKVVSNLTNLKEKGVKIIDHKKALPSFLDLFDIKIPENLKKLVDINYATAKGENAFFMGAENKIYINKEKLSLPVFHEIGHALNFNNSGFWKTMQSSKMPCMQMAGLFASLPLLTKEEKPSDGKELTKGQKFKNGLRKASPFLAFLSMAPILAEEGLASIKGCKLAKQVLDKNMYKNVLKTNAVAYSTYLIGALSFGVFAYTAKKVKDRFSNKQEQNAQKA